MNKLLLAIAMLFSVVISATEDITGIWYDSDDIGEYYIVILNNEEEGYKFLNFSFKEQDTVDEVVLARTENMVWTKVTNDDNGWEIQCVYSFVDENTLKAIYTGSYEGVDYLKRKQIK